MNPSMGQLYLNSTSEVEGATISREEEVKLSTLPAFLPGVTVQYGGHCHIMGCII